VNVDTFLKPIQERGSQTRFRKNRNFQDIVATNSTIEAQRCFPTTSYRFIEFHEESHVIIFQSYYGSKEKTIGGDELYVTLEFADMKEQVVASGHVSDLSDGRYAILFESLVAPDIFGDNILNVTQTHTNVSLSDMNNTMKFTFKNFLQYSCGVGRLPPPAKECQDNNGAINVLTDLIYPIPWVMMQNKKPPRSKPQINLKNFDRVFPFGDSLMEELFRGSGLRRDPGKLTPPWSNLGSIQFPLASDTVQQYFKIIQDTCESDQLSMPIPEEGACSTNKTLLLLNSGVWDLLEDGSLNRERFRCQAKEKYSKSKTCCNYDTEFNDHIQSLRELLSSIQEAYPNVAMGWKSMTAVHVHNVKCKENKQCMSRVKYMSSSRAETIFWKQKELIEKEFPDVLFADVYNFTRSRGHLSRPGDGRHYQNVVGSLEFKDVFG